MFEIRHYGDITKIDGHKVEIPNIITGGSPCQDLSIAGKREGLKGERSGLFMEQIRLTKELREQDVRTNQHLGMAINPRFLVWENVVGCLSSGTPKGEDFRIVLEEICKIADENANVPRPTKWNNAGCIVGNGYSVAWRVHNAAEWGVPQRRRRICVLADFNGDTAPKILFELRGETVGEDREQIVGYTGNGCSSEVLPFSKGLSGDSESSGKQREETTATIEGSVRESDRQGPGTYQSTTGTLTFGGHGGSYNGQDAYNDMLITTSQTVAYNQQAFDKYKNAETAATLTDSGGNYGGGTTTIIIQQ